MSFRFPSLLLAGAVAALAFVPCIHAQLPHAGDLVEYASDAFDYVSWNGGVQPMNRAWTLGKGGAVSLSKETNESFCRLNNVLIWRPIGATLRGDFELSADLLHQAYRRGIWVGVFNEAVTQGYGFYWDASGDDQNQGYGVASIRKHEIPGAGVLTFGSTGTLLGNAVNSRHPATTRPFANFRLQWDRELRTLSLYIDGELRAKVNDNPGFGDFSRIYVGAGKDAMIDNVSISAPAGSSGMITTETIGATEPVRR